MTEVPYLNQIKCGNCADLLKQYPDSSIDLIVTSPPYGTIRDYQGYQLEFEKIAIQLYRVVKQGGVVVWIIGDTIEDGEETGNPFQHVFFFKQLGFKLHDTMIYLKNSFSRPSSNRCHQVFEYMFVFTKGKLKTYNIIEDRKTTSESSGRASIRQKDGSLKHGKKGMRHSKYGGRFNVWLYKTGKHHSTKDKIAFKHPAIFPEALARDHIYMWSNPHDIVMDIFNGSGTTTKMAYLMHRNYIGFDCSLDYCEIAEKRLKMYEGKQQPQSYWDALLRPDQNTNTSLLHFFGK